jgi:hypothetical protein
MKTATKSLSQPSPRRASLFATSPRVSRLPCAIVLFRNADALASVCHADGDEEVERVFIRLRWADTPRSGARLRAAVRRAGNGSVPERAQA